MDAGSRRSTPRATGRKFRDFFEQYSYHFRALWLPPGVSIDGVPNDFWVHFKVTDKISYRGHAAIARDIDNFLGALRDLEVADAFMSSVTPGQKGVRGDKNYLDFYESDEAYLYGFADALREEYRAIVDAGLILQVDLGVVNVRRAYRANGNEVQRARELGVEVINHALRGIPEDRVRYHHCWGSMNTPAHQRRAAEGDRRTRCSRSTRRRTASKPPTRATSTSGWSGRTSSCPTARS